MGKRGPSHATTALEAEVAQLRATVAELTARLAQLETWPAAPRAPKRSQLVARAAEAVAPAGAATSRRGLLKRLGASAAVGAAATTLGLGQARSAQADFDGTKAGESTTRRLALVRAPSA